MHVVSKYMSEGGCWEKVIRTELKTVVSSNPAYSPIPMLNWPIADGVVKRSTAKVGRRVAQVHMQKITMLCVVRYIIYISNVVVASDLNHSSLSITADNA